MLADELEPKQKAKESLAKKKKNPEINTGIFKKVVYFGNYDPIVFPTILTGTFTLHFHS